MDCFFKEVDMIEESDTEVIVTLIDRWEMVGKAIPNSHAQRVQAPGFRNIFLDFLTCVAWIGSKYPISRVTSINTHSSTLRDQND